jgi:hypothetical protein
MRIVYNSIRRQCVLSLGGGLFKRSLALSLFQSPRPLRELCKSLEKLRALAIFQTLNEIYGGRTVCWQLTHLVYVRIKCFQFKVVYYSTLPKGYKVSWKIWLIKAMKVPIIWGVECNKILMIDGPLKCGTLFPSFYLNDANLRGKCRMYVRKLRKWSLVHLDRPSNYKCASCRH